MSERGHIPQPGDLLGGKYEIEGRLGQGGMGLVLAARNVRTNRRVAIKWLLPRLMDNTAALKRFEREAQVAGEINHPNVVNVYDIERDQDTMYIVMELLEGQSLAERLAQGRALSLEETAPIFMGVLRGVAAAHAAGVVHRDLKPDNVFLCRPRDGSAEIAKVLDFGISKLAKRENVSTITEQGALVGTVQYMSPEQLRGQDTDERTDVYALGVILYRMLSAQMPFQGANHIDLVLNMASQPARPLSHHLAGVPEGLDRAVARALERDAAARIESVEQFARALEPFFGDHPFVLHGRSSPSQRSVRPAAPLSQSYEATPFAAEAGAPDEAERAAGGRSGRGLAMGLALLAVIVALGAAGTFGVMQWRERQSGVAATPVPADAPPPKVEAPAPAIPPPRSATPPTVAAPAVAAPVDAGAWESVPAPAAAPNRRARPARPAKPPEPPAAEEAKPAPPPVERPFRAGKPNRAEF